MTSCVWQSHCWKACEALWIQCCDFIRSLTFSLVQGGFSRGKLLLVQGEEHC